jgi:acyl dehydratase
VRFAALVRLGDVVTCRGKVVAKRSAKDGGAPWNAVDLELWAETSQGDQAVTGKATVALASRG